VVGVWLRAAQLVVAAAEWEDEPHRAIAHGGAALRPRRGGGTTPDATLSKSFKRRQKEGKGSGKDGAADAGPPPIILPRLGVVLPSAAGPGGAGEGAGTFVPALIVDGWQFPRVFGPHRLYVHFARTALPATVDNPASHVTRARAPTTPAACFPPCSLRPSGRLPSLLHPSRQASISADAESWESYGAGDVVHALAAAGRQAVIGGRWLPMWPRHVTRSSPSVLPSTHRLLPARATAPSFAIRPPWMMTNGQMLAWMFNGGLLVGAAAILEPTPRAETP